MSWCESCRRHSNPHTLQVAPSVRQMYLQLAREPRKCGGPGAGVRRLASCGQPCFPLVRAMGAVWPRWTLAVCTCLAHRYQTQMRPVFSGIPRCGAVPSTLSTLRCTTRPQPWYTSGCPGVIWALKTSTGFHDFSAVAFLPYSSLAQPSHPGPTQRCQIFMVRFKCPHDLAA